MDIYSSQYTHKAHGISAPHFRGTTIPTLSETEKNQASSPRDEVQFSREAQKLSESQSVESSANSAAPRLELINRVRAEIAAGTYDSPEKMDVALERMFQSFGR